MKNHIIYKIFFAFFMLLGILSCEEREELVIEANGSPIVMDLSTESLFLDGNFPNNPALTVNWDIATYSLPTEINYKVEASKTASFEEFFALGTFKQSIKSAAFTVEQMNNAAAGVGLEPGVSGKMYLRVTSYIGTTEQLQQVSNITSLMITPYILEYPDFYIVGEASYVGWTASNAQLLYKKDNLSYIYTYLEGGKAFRFLGQQDWNPINYSIDASGIKAAYKYFKQVPGTITADGDENMKFSGTTGIYKMTIDATNGVQSLAIDASPITGFDFPEIYVVGNIAGNNWSETNAVAMTTIGGGVYEFTTTLAADTEFKILGQRSWGDLDWGNISGNGDTGFLGPKGDNGNIKFTGDGTSHKITVNLKAGTYKIVKL